MMAHSMLLIPTGDAPEIPTTQADSQGAGQTRPVAQLCETKDLSVSAPWMLLFGED